MAKFQPNYERQRLTMKSPRTETVNCGATYPLEWFTNKATKVASRMNATVEDIKMVFEFHDWNSCELSFVVERMETDDEMKTRIGREEARVAKDQENARKSRENQERQDRAALEKLISRYGRGWVENGGYEQYDDPPRE